MRAALGGLTVRGRCFVGAGITAILLGVALGQDDLFRVGVLLVALPLIAAGVVARSRFRLECERRLDPQRVAVGQETTVRLRVRSLARVPTGLLLVEDQVPYALGSSPRFVLGRLQPRGSWEVSHTVRSDVRGRFRLGPLSARLADPFGLVELSRSFAGTSTLIVTPAVVPLQRLRLLGDRSGDGASRSRAIAVAGEDDVATREYRQGDDLRRVHWPSTAHCGELMVRREEQHWQSRCVMLLDSRRAAHRGEGPGSSFEWAVSVAASVGAHLARDGYILRLYTDGGHALDGAGTSAEVRLLDFLATVAAARRASIHDAVAAVQRERAEGVLVAVLGAMEQPDAEQIAGLARGGASCVALLLDTASWLPLAAHARERAREAYDLNARTLRRGGWRVLPVEKESRLDLLWTTTGSGADSQIPVSGAAPGAAP
ncbi:MAG: DUF58 domain-containing protein [Streptosporangiaceae bacterium]